MFDFKKCELIDDKKIEFLKNIQLLVKKHTTAEQFDQINENVSFLIDKINCQNIDYIAIAYLKDIFNKNKYSENDFKKDLLDLFKQTNSKLDSINQYRYNKIIHAVKTLYFDVNEIRKERNFYIKVDKTLNYSFNIIHDINEVLLIKTLEQFIYMINYNIYYNENIYFNAIQDRIIDLEDKLKRCPTHNNIVLYLKDTLNYFYNIQKQIKKRKKK